MNMDYISMANGIEERRGGNREGSAEFPRYSWYDEDNDTWYFAPSVRALRELWSQEEKQNESV